MSKPNTKTRSVSADRETKRSTRSSSTSNKSSKNDSSTSNKPSTSAGLTSKNLPGSSGNSQHGAENDAVIVNNNGAQALPQEGRDRVLAEVSLGLGFDPFRNFSCYDGTTNAMVWLNDFESRVSDVEDRKKCWFFSNNINGEAQSWYNTRRLVQPFTCWNDVREQFLEYFKLTQGTPLDWRALYDLRMEEKELLRSFAIRTSNCLVRCGLPADNSHVFSTMMCKLSRAACSIIWKNPSKDFRELLDKDAPLANSFQDNFTQNSFAQRSRRDNFERTKNNYHQYKNESDQRNDRRPNTFQTKNEPDQRRDRRPVTFQNKNNHDQQFNYKQNFSQNTNELKCTHCGKKGHSEKSCWFTKTKVRSATFENCEIITHAYFDNKSVKTLVDTGAQACLVDEKTVQDLGLKVRREPYKKLHTINGQTLRILGICDILVEFKDKDNKIKIEWEFFVVKMKLGPHIDALIGCDLICAAGLIIDGAKRKIILSKQEYDDSKNDVETDGNHYNDFVATVNNDNSSKPASKWSSRKVIRTLHAKQHVTIPPNSCMIVECIKGPKNKNMNGDFMIKEANTKQKFIVQMKQGETKIPIVNNRKIPVILHKGYPIGKVKKNLETVEIENPKRILAARRLSEFKINLSAININDNLCSEDKQKFYNVISKHATLFDEKEFGRCSLMAHRINTGNHDPIRNHPHRQSQIKREIAQNLVNDFLKQDLVTPSESPWASPVVLVHKKNGKYRFCVDYRQLNAITTKDVYPLPNIEDSLSYLDGSKIFSIIDLRSGYHQIELHPEDRSKTAFITQDGLFEWKVMPFGLTNAPATFQRTMDTVLAGLKYNTCLVYLDDILVFSKTIDEHIKKLDMVFERLSQADLRISVEKSRFGLSEIVYLGYVISAQGQSPDPEKLSAVKNFELPKNITMLQSFLGLCNYYRKFVEGYTNISAPLYAMTTKEDNFLWTKRRIEIFELLKEKMCSPPVLTHYRQDRPHRIHTDASQVGLGAVLLQQENEGCWKPVSYISRRTTQAEANYSITELEGTAVIFALDKFRQYVEGTHFVVVTDHCALCQLKTKKKDLTEDLPDGC
jgi:hypothetical protein